jgi:ABC-type bacteriocin/lantibiotic exporter with double-glycine peptidase domain
MSHIFKEDCRVRKKDTPQDGKIRGLAKVKYALFLLKPYWKHGKAYLIISFIVAGFLEPLSAVLTTLLPQKAIDALTAGQPSAVILRVIGLFTLVVIAIHLSMLLARLCYLQPTGTKIQNKIRNDVNEKALFTDFKYYDNPTFFAKFSFAQQQYPGQAGTAAYLIPSVLKSFLTIGAMGGIIATSDPLLIGVTLVFMVLIAMLSLPTLKPEADMNVKVNDNWRPMDYVTRMLTQKENAAELRSSGAGVKFLKTVDQVNANFRAIFTQYRRKTMPFVTVQSVAGVLQISAVLAYVIIFVIRGDTSKIGLYASLTVASAALKSNLDAIASGINQIFLLSLNGARIAAFLRRKARLNRSPTANYRRRTDATPLNCATCLSATKTLRLP